MKFQKEEHNWAVMYFVDRDSALGVRPIHIVVQNPEEWQPSTN